MTQEQAAIIALSAQINELTTKYSEALTRVVILNNELDSLKKKKEDTNDNLQ